MVESTARSISLPLRTVGGLTTEVHHSSDPAIRKLHELTQAETRGIPTFSFLNDVQKTTDPVIEAFYGPLHTDRLAKVQFNSDPVSLIQVPGAEAGGESGFMLVQANTWGADIRRTHRYEGKLNEDATLVAPFGYGRLLAVMLDGASSRRPISGLAEFGVTGSWYISHIASLKFPYSKEYIALLTAPDITAKDVMISLNGWLKNELEKIEGVNYSDVLSIPGMAATIALVDYNRRIVSIAHVADTMAVAEYDTDFAVLTDDKNYQWDERKRRLIDDVVAESEKLGTHTTRVTAKEDPRVKTHLEETFRAKINTLPIGTGILNGQPELVQNDLIYSDTIEIPAEGGLKLHLMTDGVYTIWMGRGGQDSLRISARKLLGALDNPYNYPGNTLSEVAQRISLDPDGLVLARANDDSSRISLVIREGKDSVEAENFRNENVRLLLRDSDELVKARVIAEEMMHRPQPQTLFPDPKIQIQY
ncbi:MAG: protein phosphatase 2C domain-containing protein [Patescibacteria group bacterium]|nr:protein phosphatase 2C domain-containing protein [Patescibacteria group bacterium]